MLPMDRVELAAFRSLGRIGSCFTMFQSMIWLGLSAIGVVCKYIKCGATNNKRTFGHCFYLMYVYNEDDENISRLNVINPYYFNIIMWINVAMSSFNFLISTIMLTAFSQWIKAVLVKRIANVWSICIILFSICECVMCAAFIYDIIVIARNDDSKCFKEVDITVYRSVNATKPAPYLHELKQNLQNLKKKIRKLKKNLMYLNIVVDENNNPDHIDNPFISKTSLSNHVKEIWLDMFNNSITDEQQNKSQYHPQDKIIKKFVIKNEIYLDEVDTNLLKTFDNLTNIKWVKPVENGNIAIGRKYILDPNLNVENLTNINKMAILLHEYLNSINETPEKLVEADKLLDNVTKTYLGKLYEQMHDLQNKDLRSKFKNITKEIALNSTIISQNYGEEEILFYLKEFFSGLLLLEQVDDDMNENLFLSLLDKVKELFENSEHLQFDNEQKVKNIKEYLRRQYDVDFDAEPKSEMSFRRSGDNKPLPSKKLVNELCENCVFFVLWPSIVCMLLSLKTGLVWFINITVASLVLHYGDKIEVRRKSRKSSIINYE